ncbi:DUF2865 domain-containing protein [Mesorhizobium sp. KR9-304]|uniref:DUF2865 domain-containing protein n=1 Tax=Mesorhizobium sp. KR9-304 TaxID=3156614 RepID=UPI0032B3A94A
MTAGPRRLGRHAALIAIAVALASLLPDTSLAASRVCRQLEAELATAGSRPAAPSRKQEAAIARQQEQIQLARRQARSAGCGFKLFGRASSSCSAINVKIDRMERNLQALERRRSKTASAGAGRSRSSIVAALNANGCRDQAVAERRPPRGVEGSSNLFDQIFGGGIRQRGSIDELGDPSFRRYDEQNVRRVPESIEGGWVNDGGRIRYSAPPGNYRTLCVRTCDGYYFPISNASSPWDFERDQQNCQSSCPGTEVQIYYHRPSQESQDMVSGLSGAPYSDLPAAWLYKQSGTPSPAGCACNAPRNDEARNFSVVAGNPPAEKPVQTQPMTPYPSGRPDAAADPETLANLDGGLDAEALRRMAVTPRVNKSKATGDDKRIRVVGPVFLPDPATATDQQAPDPNPVR